MNPVCTPKEPRSEELEGRKAARGPPPPRPAQSPSRGSAGRCALIRCPGPAVAAAAKAGTAPGLAGLGEPCPSAAVLELHEDGAAQGRGRGSGGELPCHQQLACQCQTPPRVAGGADPCSLLWLAVPVHKSRSNPRLNSKAPPPPPRLRALPGGERRPGTLSRAGLLLGSRNLLQLKRRAPSQPGPGAGGRLSCFHFPVAPGLVSFAPSPLPARRRRRRLGSAARLPLRLAKGLGPRQ
ncbi:unnamed protein product [Lepidochelys kempii]